MHSDGFSYSIVYNKDKVAKRKAKSNYIKKKRKQSVNNTKSAIFLKELKRFMKKEKQKYYSKVAREYLGDLKKEGYRYKDMQHPMFKKHNRYRLNYFQDHILFRSLEGLTARQAWALVDKCWKGFKKSYRIGYQEGIKYYGEGLSKYLYLLEEVQPDFSHLGIKPYKPYS